MSVVLGDCEWERGLMDHRQRFHNLFKLYIYSMVWMFLSRPLFITQTLLLLRRWYWDTSINHCNPSIEGTPMVVLPDTDGSRMLRYSCLKLKKLKCLHQINQWVLNEIPRACFPEAYENWLWVRFMNRVFTVQDVAWDSKSYLIECFWHNKVCLERNSSMSK